MILIKVDFQTKKDIAAIHWEWFKLRMTKQCPWEKKRTQSYYDFIKENVCLDSSNLSDSEYKEKLRLLICGLPKGSNKTFFEKINQLNSQKDWYSHQKLVKKTGENRKKFKNRKMEAKLCVENLKKAFGYDDLSHSPDYKDWKSWEKSNPWYVQFKINNGDKDWNTKVLYNELKLSVCPYCNRQYIFSYQKGNYSKNTAEMDHFYPKSSFPHLSCSLYNLVPSCKVCNHTKLTDNPDEFLYPYEESFEENPENLVASFRIRRNDNVNIKFPITAEETNIKIETNDENNPYSDKIHSAAKLLAIEELYTMHKLDLNDLLSRHAQYGKFKRADLCKLLGVSEEFLKKMVYGFPLENKKNEEYILRKFKKDIVEQLESI